MGVGSFVAFYQRYYRLILTVAQQRLEGHGGAEDVTAEVFRIAWAHDQGGGELTLSWLYQTLRNVIGNEYRRMSKAPDLGGLGPEYAAAPVPSSPSPDDEIDIRALMMELSLDDREVLFMAYWEDLTRAEIAEILGCSEVAVRVRLLRARGRLAAMLKASERESVGKGE